MVTIDEVLSAKSWRHLNLAKTKSVLKDLQREFHPDINKSPQANDAFVKVGSLFESSDFDLRLAKGTSVDKHHIKWEPKNDFHDRLKVAVDALTKLGKLPEKFNRFFPKIRSFGPDQLTVSYGEGWWFLDDFPKFDSRTCVWIAKRGAGAIKKASECGLVHGDINPKTVVLLPSEHGLMLDGWWSSVPIGERLVIKPDTVTPPKYFGGAPADEKLMVAQFASMLTRVCNPDKVLLDVLKRSSLGTTDAVTFYHDVNNAAEKLYGPSSWHPLNNPSVTMI